MKLLQFFLDKTIIEVVYLKLLKPVIGPSSRRLEGKRPVTIITPRSAPALLELLKQGACA